MPYQSRARENVLAHFAPGTSRCFRFDHLSRRRQRPKPVPRHCYHISSLQGCAAPRPTSLRCERERKRGREGRESESVERDRDGRRGGGGDAHLSVRIHTHIPAWIDATHARKHTRQHTALQHLDHLQQDAIVLEAHALEYLASATPGQRHE